MEHIIESLKRQREQLLAEKGDDLYSRHTSLLEIAIISLYNRLINRLSPATEQFRSSGAIMALGSFGHGLVGPADEVSLLFIRVEPFPSAQNWVEEVVEPLREAGWQVICEQIDGDELVKRAALDHELLVELLSGRYISGNRSLVETLDGRLQTVIAERRQELAQSLREGVEGRRRAMREPGHWLEPSVLEAPGGLHDIRAIRAACRILLNIRCFEDAVFQGYLLREEVEQLQRAEKRYLRWLSLLTEVTGNRSGTLGFEQQEILAARLAYCARSGFLPVESFMRDLFQSFDEVNRVLVRFGQRLKETGHYGGREVGNGRRTLEPGLDLRHGNLVLHPADYPASAAAVVHLFAIAAAERAGFSCAAAQWIQHHANLLETAAGDRAVRDELLSLLLLDSPQLHALRSFYDFGLLGAMIPEIAAVHCLVQHDAFHLYPLHEHHFRTLAELKRLRAGEHAGTAPELTALAEAVADLPALYLAAIVHDIGKSAGADHAKHGAAMIPAMAQRLGLDPDTTDTLQFLVGHHLLLMDSASMRDLADQEMISQCAQQVGTVERLRLLLILSFADMLATGPKALQKWRETPVDQLAEKIRTVLEKGEPGPESITARLDQVRALVEPQVRDLMSGADLSTHFAQLAPRYLLSMPPAAIAEHLRLERELEGSLEPFAWIVKPLESSIEITIMGRRTHGLLTKAAGVLTLHALDIVGAQVFTKNNGVVLLVFQCRARAGGAAAPAWDAVGRHMKRLLEGKLALDYRIALQARQLKDATDFPSGSRSRVLIDNESSQLYTILEVYTSDRFGLLYSITRTLMDLEVRIDVAKITTKVDQAADIFYLRSLDGEKVLDREQLQEIKNALLFRLDGPSALSGAGGHAT